MFDFGINISLGRGVNRLFKAAVLGFVTGAVGLLVSVFPFAVDLEENFGLEMLFHLRGVRQPPSDVVIVGIDKPSADRLGLPNDPRKWPRSLHARLTEILAREGAAVIGFDVIFEEPRSDGEDKAFANAIREARKVVLCERIKTEKVPLTGGRGSSQGDLSVVKLIPPIKALEQSAAALAPFPLPKVPFKVSQYWTFKTGAGDTPTLPVVAFQFYAMGIYDEFIHSLVKVSPYPIEKARFSKDAAIESRSVGRLISGVRDIFEKDPSSSARMFEEVSRSKFLSSDGKKLKLMTSLIDMYQSANSRYLNFYGPPRTITTIPYYQVLDLDEDRAGNPRPDFKGKAVFVGLSELVQPEQKDGFNTVFTQSDGLDISGVEIVATAFANLVEDMPLRPLSLPSHVATILLWGVAVGMLSRLFSTTVAALSVAGLSVLYFVGAEYQFKNAGVWYPIVIPLFLQTSLAFYGALLWKYVDSTKERQNIRNALGYYLPNEVIHGLEKNMVDIKESRQLVYGICLSTDAEQYTSLCESMEPDELSSFMNRYYEAVFDPVKKHEGVVSNVIGDSMLALWVAPRPGAELRNKACLAALDIVESIHGFNRSNENYRLPTRIGLHSGRIVLGSLGAIDHYEYRPIGDIVNTATRIEGLNKYLGTQLLISDEMAQQLDGLITREIGKFLLAGKSRPLVVHELVSRAENVHQRQRDICQVFSMALDAFRRQAWDEAINEFNQAIGISGGDGPSHFYIKLCLQYRNNPPGDSWNGVVHMDKK